MNFLACAELSLALPLSPVVVAGSKCNRGAGTAPEEVLSLRVRRVKSRAMWGE